LASPSNNNNNNGDSLDMKAELTKYLALRKEVGADEAMKMDVGKVVGGTKGNIVLDYVSGSPNKEMILDTMPNVFDYSELDKYGFGVSPWYLHCSCIERFRLSRNLDNTHTIIAATLLTNLHGFPFVPLSSHV
jgi:hypothetical protein